MAIENREQKREFKHGDRFNRKGRRGEQQPVDDGIVTKTVSINRVAKVVKGGRNMHFSALVVAGDENGKVGVGLGKAKEVPAAIEKANKAARNSMLKIATEGTTIPHAIEGVYGKGKVLLIPAEEGTGVIAGGAVRAVLEVSGIKDIRTKSIGSPNPINTVRATLEGLKALRTREMIEALRGVSIEKGE